MEPTELVAHYLSCMFARNWDGLAATLAPDVVRHGPYNDTFVGPEAYVSFLRSTFDWMQDYEMEIHRIWGEGDLVCAELAETVTLDGRRLRTEEALVIEVRERRIQRVSIFLQKSTEQDQA